MPKGKGLKTPTFQQNVSFEVDDVDTNPTEDETKALDDFFGGIERQVNGMITEPDQMTASEPNLKDVNFEEEDDDLNDDDFEDEVESSEDAKDLAKKLKSLQKSYEDSSAEGKRLYAELQELKQYEKYLPLLNVMKNDPNLVRQVADYLESGSQPNVDIPEDVILDLDEALRDPKSPSAKVLQQKMAGLIDSEVSRRLGEYERQSYRKTSLERQQKELADKFGLDEDGVEDLVQWAKSNPLTMEDLYYLKNREQREKDIAKKAMQDKLNHSKRMSGLPRSLASKGDSRQAEPDDEQVLFKHIQRAIEGGNLF